MGGPIVLNGRVTVRERITGVERLAREVIGRLAADRPDLYRVVTPRGAGSKGAGAAWEQCVLPALAARLRAPLVYSPANLAPVAWPRNVLVLHDASVWRSPGSFSTAYTRWHRAIETAAARRAVRVITVSEFSRRELVEVVGLAPESVSVVPNGVGRQFRPDADPEPVRRRYGLERPYVLMVGSGQARKNLPLLRTLAERLSAEGLDMVWAGGGPEVAAGSGGLARAIGYVAESDLPGLYRGAEVFTMPSVYEGFGIPCLEAMACGTPVVAADRSALPETCGGAAVLADPGDAEAFASAVVTVAGDTAERSRLRSLGLERAAGFTWERAAAETDAILRGLAGRA